jgi:hypothetical protein
MIVVFIHGWSVRHTDTYGGLPRYAAAQRGADGRPIEVANVFLGRYLSFVDAVTLEDLVRALDQALADALGRDIRAGRRFACITHSTGGPVVRAWIDRYHRKHPDTCPLSHLIMLAPANHGSALAQLGKGRLSRLKSFVQGVQPGERILDWLELGSAEAWSLNESWLDFDGVPGGVFPFVLTGQTIDRTFYDALNSYTDEMGSDGVVRVASANLNYGFLELVQQPDGELQTRRIWRAKPTAFGVLPRVAHSGDDLGILRSVSGAGYRPPRIVSGLGLPRAHPTAEWVMRCLRVRSATEYGEVTEALSGVTAETQANERVEKHRSLFWERVYRNDRCLQVIVRLRDHQGHELADYDLYLTAGPRYSEQELPAGFFVDRQRNRRHPARLTYYLNWDVLESGLNEARLQGRFGFRIQARPAETSTAVVYFRTLDFRSDLLALKRALRPNETLMLDIELNRQVDVAVFRLGQGVATGAIDPRPTGRGAK